MIRRTFLAATMALTALPALAGGDDYKPGMIQKALDDGKTVFVDYAADWCSTCARQERIIKALRAANPDYDANIVFVRVDWDDFGTHEVTTSRQIPRRSTLILLKGDQELGRIVAGTSEDEIKALLDKGLSKS